MHQHIAVIGAGITGVTTAYLLLQQGYRRQHYRLASLSGDGDIVCEWRTTFGQQRRGVEPLVNSA